MSKTRSIKRPVTAVPKSLEEAAEFLSLIGKEKREIETIQSVLNEKIEELKSRAMVGVRPREEKISQLVEGLFAFAESNREKLTDGGKRKTVKLPTGLFGWRMTRPAISLRNVKEVLKSLKSLGLDRFIRTKEKVDKETMLKEPEVAKTVKGVTISQREEFVVKPTEIEIEIVSDAKKLKKALT